MSPVTNNTIADVSESVSVATLADLPGLMALERSFLEGQRWSEDSWRGELTGKNRHAIVCRDGAGTVQAAATYAMSADVVDLHRIVTVPAARRLGLARVLLNAGICWARDMGATRMLLEVDHGNAPALSLYGAHGFHRIAERRDYYGPGAHAVILEREVFQTDEGEPS